MDTANPLVALALALGIGLLIGTQRGWQLRGAADGSRVAGVRTHGLLGLLGGILGVIVTNPALTTVAPLRWIAVIGALGVIFVLVLGYRNQLATDSGAASATGTLTAILTMLLGALAASGMAAAAVVTAGVVVLLLSLRERLHGWLRDLAAPDMRAAVQYIVIVCVIWPILPDHDFGPYDAWNPRLLWLVVVFVTGLSFAGYVAGKHLGPARGTVTAAAIGATYSSTAVSAELARRLRAPNESITVLRAGIAAATAVMALRVIVLVVVLVPAARLSFVLLMVPATLFAIGFALILARKADTQPGPAIAARNPFDFWPAVGFAALVGSVILVSRWAIDHYGGSGLTAVVALTGFYDVDAAIIMLGNLPSTSMTPQRLGLLMALPILINTLWKAVVVMSLGGLAEGSRAAVPLFGVALLLSAAMLAAWAAQSVFE